MTDPADSDAFAPPPPNWTATWQDHPLVRLVLFAAAFGCGLVAIDVADPPGAADLRFLWMTLAPFAMAFVVRHVGWPIAATVGYHVGAWAPNVSYDRLLEPLGQVQPWYAGMTALAGMGVVWTVQGFRAGYRAAAPPPLDGRGPIRRPGARLLAATLVYGAGFAPILLTGDPALAAPSIAWLAIAPLLLAPAVRARLWPFAAALVAGPVMGWVLWTEVPPDWLRMGVPADWRVPVAAGGLLFAAPLAWATAGVGFLLAASLHALRERWRER